MKPITSVETSETWITAVRAALTRLQCDSDQREPYPHEVQEQLLEGMVTYDAEIAMLDKQLPPLRTEGGVIIIDTPAHDLIPHERGRWFNVTTLYETLAWAIRLARSSQEKTYAAMAQKHLALYGYEAFWIWQEIHGIEGHMPGKDPWLCSIEDCDSGIGLTFTPEDYQMILPTLAQLKDNAGGWTTWEALERLWEA